MTAAADDILCVPSSASADAGCRGKVLISGSYGGEYNAYHAAKWGLRGVILSDAGVGKDGAGIAGLPYLERIGLAAATVDIFTGRIADPDDMRENGRISHANAPARGLGVERGMDVRDTALLLTKGPVCTLPPPPIDGGKRHDLPVAPGRRPIVCLDAAPMLRDDDAGAVVITGSHAALFRGRPDGIVKPQVWAIFFNDAGVGKDRAGIARLADLETRGIAAGTVSADSAPIGNARAAYAEGVLSFVNESAQRRGIEAGMRLQEAAQCLSRAN